MGLIGKFQICLASFQQSVTAVSNVETETSIIVLAAWEIGI